MSEPADVRAGDEIPPWTMPSVDPARMRTMAAILRDPYPVHWDREANAALGLPGRVINQGPLNLGYIVNMLLAWAGPSCVRRLTVSFGRPVLDGDSVTARGRVTELADVDGERRATCEVWLDRNGEHVVTGTAVVALVGVQSHDYVSDESNAGENDGVRVRSRGDATGRELGDRLGLARRPVGRERDRDLELGA